MVKYIEIQRNSWKSNITFYIWHVGFCYFHSKKACNSDIDDVTGRQKKIRLCQYLLSEAVIMKTARYIPQFKVY